MEEHKNDVTQKRPTILLVDVEEPILNSLRRLLRSQPYEVLWQTAAPRPWKS